MYLNDSTINQIHKLSHQISEFTKLRVPVKDIEYIVKRLGGKIEYDDNLSAYCDGKIRKVLDNDSDVNFIITIPTGTKKKDLNYKVSKQLGHLFLTMGYLIKYDKWLECDGNNITKYAGKMDFAASEFALELIIPIDEVRLELENYQIFNNIYDIKALADYFHVSYETMKYWGRSKGIFKEYNIYRKDMKYKKSS